MEMISEGRGGIGFSFLREEVVALADRRRGCLEGVVDGKYVQFITVVASPFNIRRWPVSEDRLRKLGIPAAVGERFLVNEVTVGKLYTNGEVRVRFSDEMLGGNSSTLIMCMEEPT